MGELREINYGVYYIVFLCEYADALSLAGQPQQGLVEIEEALRALPEQRRELVRG